MIVVFGSVNVDFVTGVARIPRPGETVLGPDYAVHPGGKGANQALAAARAGAPVRLVAAVGRDPFAEVALALLRAEGVDLSGVATVDAPTGAAFIAVDDMGENAITVAAGANRLARAHQLDDMAIGESDIVLLQREVPDVEVAAAARLARWRGARVMLNAAPAGTVPASLLADLDMLIVNEHEVEIVGAGVGLSGTADEIARALDARGTPTIVTLGGDGALGWRAGQRVAVPALPITPVDTTGAGDTFCGAFAAALHGGEPFAAALRYAAAAGSLACTRPGAQPSLPRRDAIVAALTR